MKKYILFVTSLFFLVGTNSSFAQGIFAQANQNIEINSRSAVPANENRIMTVKQEVKGNDVFVECVISNFTFSNRNDKNRNDKNRNDKNRNESGTGFLQLYLNGKKIDEIYTAAFIIKGLPVGKHMIKLELVQNDGTPYGVEKEIEVTI